MDNDNGRNLAWTVNHTAFKDKLIFFLCLANKNMLQFVFCFLFFLLLLFFSIRLSSVLRGHSFFSSLPQGQWPLTSKDFYTRSYPLHCFLILILEKEPLFPFSMLSALHGIIADTVLSPVTPSSNCYTPM